MRQEQSRGCDAVSLPRTHPLTHALTEGAGFASPALSEIVRTGLSRDRAVVSPALSSLIFSSSNEASSFALASFAARSA